MKIPKPSLSWLLVFVPAAVALEHLAPTNHTMIFIAACIAVLPLAGWLGKATEHLATHAGEGLGGLLNATFGNAAEMIIAIMALRRGLLDVVKASITGSIIGNILLVLGAAFLAGGIRHESQKFNIRGARAQAMLLTLAAAALIAEAAFHHLGGEAAVAREGSLSVAISIVLLVAYGLGLIFTLKTHKHLFEGHTAEAAEVELQRGHGEHGEPWSLKKAMGVLLLSTAVIAWMSEILVASVEGAAESLGMSSLFVGVVVVAIVGNAAEHSTAILMAWKNRNDLAVGIAVGSSIQIALFVAPVLVLLSYWIAPRPMDLVFTPAEVIAVALAVLITEQMAGDGESNWLEGAMLLALYAVLGIVFYLLPVAEVAGAGGH